MLKELGFTSMAEEFIEQLSELRNMVNERLLTTPLEVLQRKEFIDDVNSNTAKINNAIENMQNDLADLAEDSELKVFIHYFCISTVALGQLLF